ncbi:MAG: zinc ribbon domain-containing protein [Propionibacteriaceae bacterium]|jgi:hypothetical protein|nr:zinc ribbon domain-containing protein [Propionibacteriaceae bacterium]
MQAFVRNYQDESTDAGFQYTFYCDRCHDGFKSSFIESATYKKGRGLRNIADGAGIVGSLFGGAIGNLGWAAERGGDRMASNMDGRSPAWRQEYEQAFQVAQNEASRHFKRCNSCTQWVCFSCFNDDEGLCVQCAPLQNIAVAKARADAMQRNIDEAAQTATVWQGKIESQTTVCPSCGKPTGIGKFCNNCGASTEMRTCGTCGGQVALGVRFCSTCGANMAAPPAPPAPPPGVCGGCGFQNAPGTNFCGNCGNKVG